MTDPPLDDRICRALRIIASPYLFKVCAGCDSIVGGQVGTCPNCHGYRFVEGEAAVIRQARLLAGRPQRSVTAADLAG